MNEKTLIIDSISDGLEEALFSYIKTNYSGIEPLYIVVPNNLCGLYLSRKLARKLFSHSNVKFITIIDLAKKLAIKTLAEQELMEIPSFLDQVLILEIIKLLDESSYFSKVVNLHGFPDALIDTFRDLSQGGIDKFDFVEKDKDTFSFTAKKLGELSKLYNKFIETRYSYKFYDNDYIIKIASECENAEEVLGTDKISIYGIYDLNYIQWKFIKALSDQLNITLFFPYKDNIQERITSERHLSKEGISRYANYTFDLFINDGFKIETIKNKVERTPLMEFQSKWFGEERVTCTPPIKILSCFMPLKEVEEIARRIIILAKQGVPFYDMAIITLSSSLYLKLIESIFQRTGIPYYISDTEPDYSNRILRSAVLLLNLINSKLPRQDVIDFLQYASVPYEKIIGKKFVRDTLFDKISMIAGVIEGKDNWLKNLDSYIDSFEFKDEDETSTNKTIYIETANVLKAIIEHISDDISIFPIEGYITEYLNLTINIIKKFIPDEDEIGIVEEVKKEIEKLEFLNVKLKWRDFKKIILSVIETIQPDKGSFQKNGVNVLSPMISRGLRFRVVFLPGLSEDAFPTKGKQDPLLLDFEREDLNRKIEGFLPLKRERSNEDLQLLAMAIDSATEQIYITYPKYTGVGGDDTFPSYYISTILQTLLDKKPSYNELLSGEGLTDEIFENIPYSSTDKNEYITLEEYDLSAITQAYRKKDTKRISEILDEGLFPFTRKGLEQWFMTLKKGFNKYSGLIENNVIKELIYDRFISNGVSPTSLQDYAICPYKFLLKRILNITILSEPEKILAISPILIGSIIHEILHRAYEKIKNKDNIVSIKEFGKYTDIINETINKKFKDIIDTFPEEYRFLIREEILLLSPLIERAIDYDSSEEPEWELLYLESRFGRSRPQSENILTEEPLRKELEEGLNIDISGKVDRIDVNREKNIIRLIDYKVTKHKEKYDRDKMSLSHGLQAFFYTLFSKEHFKNYIDHIFQYRVLDRANNNIFPFNLTSNEIETSSEDILNRIKIIMKFIREGVFIPLYDEKEGDCIYCDYNDICPTKNSIIRDRKTKNDARFSELELLFTMKIFQDKSDEM
jgi:ATP-dependent helicase/DNAse subunit B